MIHDVVGRDTLPVTADPAQATKPSETRSLGMGQRNVREAESPVEPAAGDQNALGRAVAKIQDAFQQVDSRLKIEIDPGLNRVVVKVMNEQSGEIIRQIP